MLGHILERLIYGGFMIRVSLRDSDQPGLVLGSDLRQVALAFQTFKNSALTIVNNRSEPIIPFLALETQGDHIGVLDAPVVRRITRHTI